MTNQVPRVASSLDDLRMGQVIVVQGTGPADDWGKPYQIVGGFDHWFFDRAKQVVILSDPPPEPVTVSREAFDRLAEAVDKRDSCGGLFYRGPLADAARAFVDEAKGQTDAC